MDAGDVIQLVANTESGDIGFDARVLFWWEVQQSRESSIVTADIVTKRVFDRSKFMRKMIDGFVVSIQDGGRTISETNGRRWSQCLHPSAIKPFYDAYIGACHSSPSELAEFRNKVARYLGASEDADDGIFIAPPELFEVMFMTRCGGLTLSEMRGLSYDRFRKFLIVIEHLGSVFAPTMAPSGVERPMVTDGVPGIPLSVLSNPNLTPIGAKMQSEAIALQDARQGQFGHRPE